LSAHKDQSHMGSDKDPADGAATSLMPAARKPTPTLNADAIAILGPDSD